MTERKVNIYTGELLAGPELDEQVIRDVLRWPIEDAPAEIRPSKKPIAYRDAAGFAVNATIRGVRRAGHFSPSDQIDAAWVVVETLVGAPDYAVAFCVSPWPDGGWLAGFALTDKQWAREQKLLMAKLTVVNPFPDWEIIDGFGAAPDQWNGKPTPAGFTGHGSTAPEAICHAALKVAEAAR